MVGDPAVADAPTGVPIGRDELAVDVLDAAVRLLGCSVEADTPEGTVAVRLVEVEAYRGADDPASHSFRGRTARNAVMFGPPGHLYVYFVYGMHYCANVTCLADGEAGAVLLRAGEVTSDLAMAFARRPTARRAAELARGPARLAALLGLGSSHNGLDLTDPRSPVRVLAGPPADPAVVRTGPRVGVAAAHETPWRFWIADSARGEPVPPGPGRRDEPGYRWGRIDGVSTTNADGPGSTGGTDILDELEWRGLIAQTTDRDALRRELAAGVLTLYCGFDPTGPSLHAGHLIPLLTLRRFQQAGNRPIVLAGGATGQIGDPRDLGERTLQSTDTVADWVQRIRGQLERFVEFDGSPTGAVIANNLDWTGSQTVLEFLRDCRQALLGQRHARARDGQAAAGGRGHLVHRVQLLLLQSQDYLHLFRREGCRLQIGGSDQWGNIVGGVELIRRVEGATAHALTVPLITDSEGRKFGKSTGGANIWLDPQMTSPYAWYQYFVQRRRCRRRAVPADVHLPAARGDRAAREGRRRAATPARRAAPVGHGADHTRPRRPPDRPRWSMASQALVRPGGSE
jgi:DNA-3-methyladenine glycosylase